MLCALICYNGWKRLIMREVFWVGDSLKRLKEFPEEAQQSIGRTLMTIQFGKTPHDVKPFKGVGSGVFEIVERYDKNAYRVVYALQIGEKIYVLHAFQKKSKSGIATPPRDIDLINQRYKEAQEMEDNADD